MAHKFVKADFDRGDNLISRFGLSFALRQSLHSRAPERIRFFSDKHCVFHKLFSHCRKYTTSAMTFDVRKCDGIHIRVFGDHCKCAMIGSDALLSIPTAPDAETVRPMLLGDQSRFSDSAGVRSRSYSGRICRHRLQLWRPGLPE